MSFDHEFPFVEAKEGGSVRLPRGGGLRFDGGSAGGMRSRACIELGCVNTNGRETGLLVFSSRGTD